jgi:putative nucleotidyltransferase with HDIG domain
MSVSPSSYRRRIRRAGSVDAPRGFWGGLVTRLQQSEVLMRLSLCGAVAIGLALVMRGWSPPFDYRVGMVAPRGVAARVPFERPDLEKTRQSQERAAAQVRVIYSQDKLPIERVRDALKNRLAEIAAAPELSTASVSAWSQFSPEAAEITAYLPAPPQPPTVDATGRRILPVAPEPPVDPIDPVEPQAPPEEPDPEVRAKVEAAQADYAAFRGRIDGKEKLLEVGTAIDRAFGETVRAGVLENIQHGIDDGSQTDIDVYPVGNPTELKREAVADVLLGEAKVRLRTRLIQELGDTPFTTRLVDWIEPQVVGTLRIDRESTEKAKREAIAKAPQQFNRYAAGDLLVLPGIPIKEAELDVLRLEQAEYVRQADAGRRLGRMLSLAGLFVAMFALAGFYLHLHHRTLLEDLGHVATLLGLSAATVVACMLASVDTWQAEVVPLLVFAMTAAIAYDEDVSLLLSAQVALVLVVGLGKGLADYVTLTAACAAAIFWMGRIRSRSKLIYVGLWAAVVAMATKLGAAVLDEHPFDLQLLYEVGRTGVWTVLAGFLMTGLLPFVERFFGVLTDLSLLEIGDIAHPLLQELVRRAPGTYNHSINVASLAETAAEAIGARGLLVRVGAYFHDVGKMLKPAYFIENQGQEGNRHETLVPAMSTLIIVAHVKEGAELARQYRLPQPIIDMILEHHGTTLVEYFYRRAAARSESDPNGSDVDEHAYRYPGPKPASRESAVMMLADAAESASRTLTEPTPARIASLVHELMHKRLIDGQFDECGITLQELETVEQSIVKSLTAVYHGRVKYPDQRTA